MSLAFIVAFPCGRAAVLTKLDPKPDAGNASRNRAGSASQVTFGPAVAGRRTV
jgi:hypothetical protein